jgi:hypothetical protein
VQLVDVELSPVVANACPEPETIEPIITAPPLAISELRPTPTASLAACLLGGVYRPLAVGFLCI